MLESKTMNTLRRVFILILTCFFVLSAAPVGAQESIVNIGMTDAISTINPILLDATEVVRYATALAYDPLMELNADLEMVPILAESVTTEDNLSYTITLNPDAAWSDGEPITADDVLFTVKNFTSRAISNTSMSIWATVEGFGEDGFIDDENEDVSGLQKVDDRTFTVTLRDPIPQLSFENTFLRYIFPVPSHILGDRTASELKTDPWFLKPDVVSGPYFPTSFDSNHYVTYVANENYWRGAPQIDKLNIQVIQASQVLTSLQSGEIDFIQQTTSSVPQADHEAIEALDNVTVHYGQPVTNQLTFLNTEKLPDVKLRKALLMGIDRDFLLEQLLRGKGEIIDGFTTSASPYFDETLEVTPFDPDAARDLVEESDYDGRPLVYKINSGDPTFLQGVNILAQQWADIGVNVEIQTLDLGNLLADAGAGDYDIFTVQYTLVPVDPYPDIYWLIGGEGDNWPRYATPELNEVIMATQTAESKDELVELYRQIDETMQEDVPLFSTYVISGLGATSNRLQGAQPDVYGSLINVHEWTLED